MFSLYFFLYFKIQRETLEVTTNAKYIAAHAKIEALSRFRLLTTFFKMVQFSLCYRMISNLCNTIVIINDIVCAISTNIFHKTGTNIKYY